MHVLYVSQLAGAEHPRRAAVLVEGIEIPRILAGFGVRVSLHDATLAPPPDPGPFDGVVVGGSFGSANDPEPWRADLAGWLATHQAVPLLGICGGHQLLARALGGVVEVAPGPQTGVYPLALPGIPGFTGCVVQMHNDRVAVPPAGAEVWSTDEMGIQALRYGPHRWTFQFHPEMDRPLLVAAEAVPAEPADAPPAWVGLDDAIEGGRAILRAWLATLRPRVV